jgi:flagellar basal body-associated protein FliL
LLQCSEPVQYFEPQKVTNMKKIKLSIIVIIIILIFLLLLSMGLLSGYNLGPEEILLKLFGN